MDYDLNRYNLCINVYQYFQFSSATNLTVAGSNYKKIPHKTSLEILSPP